MAITIIKQPTNVTAVVGDNINFSVIAEGEGLIYQWQYKRDAQTTWTNSGATGATTDTLTVTTVTGHNGLTFRCVITDANGDSINTSTVFLTVLASLPEKGLIDLSIMQDIANAVREKTGKTDPMLPADMATEIENIESGSGDIDALVTRTISEYSNDSLTTIGNYAFADCTELLVASFPACSYIGKYAFAYCSVLTTASFPACTTTAGYIFTSCPSLTTVFFPECLSLGAGAFGSCAKLTTASFPKCTTIGNSVFTSCTKLTTVSFPVCTTIGNYAFMDCASLTTAFFPVCTTIGNYAFDGCSKLTTASFPKCTAIGSNAFSSCSNLTTISFPLCSTIGNYAFTNCSKLTTASFPVCTNISGYAFSKCYRLSSLKLGSNCTLVNSNAFNSTPFAGYKSYYTGTPHIYVPSSRLSYYKSATNWSKFSSYFVGY